MSSESEIIKFSDENDASAAYQCNGISWKHARTLHWCITKFQKRYIKASREEKRLKLKRQQRHGKLTRLVEEQLQWKKIFKLLISCVKIIKRILNLMFSNHDLLMSLVQSSMDDSPIGSTSTEYDIITLVWNHLCQATQIPKRSISPQKRTFTDKRDFQQSCVTVKSRSLVPTKATITSSPMLQICTQSTTCTALVAIKPTVQQKGNTLSLRGPPVGRRKIRGGTTIDRADTNQTSESIHINGIESISRESSQYILSNGLRDHNVSDLKSIDDNFNEYQPGYTSTQLPTQNSLVHMFTCTLNDLVKFLSGVTMSENQSHDSSTCWDMSVQNASSSTRVYLNVEINSLSGNATGPMSSNDMVAVKITSTCAPFSLRDSPDLQFTNTAGKIPLHCHIVIPDAKLKETLFEKIRFCLVSEFSVDLKSIDSKASAVTVPMTSKSSKLKAPDTCSSHKFTPSYLPIQTEASQDSGFCSQPSSLMIDSDYEEPDITVTNHSNINLDLLLPSEAQAKPPSGGQSASSETTHKPATDVLVANELEFKLFNAFKNRNSSSSGVSTNTESPSVQPLDGNPNPQTSITPKTSTATAQTDNHPQLKINNPNVDGVVVETKRLSLPQTNCRPEKSKQLLHQAKRKKIRQIQRDGSDKSEGMGDMYRQSNDSDGAQLMNVAFGPQGSQPSISFDTTIGFQSDTNDFKMFTAITEMKPTSEIKPLIPVALPEWPPTEYPICIDDNGTAAVLVEQASVCTPAVHSSGEWVIPIQCTCKCVCVCVCACTLVLDFF